MFYFHSQCQREKDRLNQRIVRLEEELLEKHEELNNMEEKIEHLEEMNRVLIAKERKSNYEFWFLPLSCFRWKADFHVQQGLKELPSSASSSFIGINNMGDLDYKPFYTAIKKKYPSQEAS